MWFASCGPCIAVTWRAEKTVLPTSVRWPQRGLAHNPKGSTSFKPSGQKESRTAILFHLLMLTWLVPTSANKAIRTATHSHSLLCVSTHDLPFLYCVPRSALSLAAMRPVLVIARLSHCLTLAKAAPPAAHFLTLLAH